jgi:hypothetical protein
MSAPELPDGEELLDLLGQRPALLQQLFAAVLRTRGGLSDSRSRIDGSGRSST